MLTQRDRDWSTIKESMRRQRTVQDLLRRSGASRLRQRILVYDHDRADWRRSERFIIETERAIKALDSRSPDFWTQFRKHSEELNRLYDDAHVNFDS